MSEARDAAPGDEELVATAPHRTRLVGWRRRVANRRALGRAIMVAAVVACVTSLVGIVVAWRLVGNLADTTGSSLAIVSDTLVTVDDTLDVADSVIESVDSGIGTVRDSLSTISTNVDNSAAALDAFANLTERLPASLERIDAGLGGLQSAADTVDDVLRQLSDIPFGPDYSPESDLGESVQSMRDDLQPIADDLASASGSLRELAGSSGDLIARLDALGEDLRAVDESLDESGELVERYRASTADAATLATVTQSELDRDVWLSRVLIVVLGVAIAVGQIAPFRIGRELARTPDAQRR